MILALRHPVGVCVMCETPLRDETRIFYLSDLKDVSQAR